MNEEVFFAGHEAAKKVYDSLLEKLIWRYPELEIRVAKTQISFYERHMFGCVSFTRVLRKALMPESFLTLTIGLPEPLESSRIAVKVEPYPGRWTHHIVISNTEELDDELFSWIEEAHEFALMKR